MPEIARFYGIVIFMYFFDHNPPHLHARHGRAKAVFRLADGKVLRGELPRLGTAMIQNWMVAHRAELEENWRLASSGEMPEKIAGPDGRD
ncbi:MAG TPA: DUF4160 domain-containing protein [Devosia sp.]|jgi:hypothetical protein|nr:DUF4160 domain-containing protein [Devosia sp.]